MIRLCGRRFASSCNASSLKENQAFSNPLGFLDNTSSFKNFRCFANGVFAQRVPQITDGSKSTIGQRKNVGILASLMGGSRSSIHTTSVKENDNGGLSSSMDFVKGILEDDRGSYFGSPRLPQYNSEEKLDIVHIKLIKNNTFVTVTDSKGNKKAGASSGCLEEMKGGPKASRYAAEATAEHVGRLSKKLGLKSVVMRVNGFTHFKKKKQAILSWREGFTNGRGDQNPIVFIEDTTRKPHNGCRLRKRRRI